MEKSYTQRGVAISVLYHVSINGKARRIELQRVDDGWVCRVDGREFRINAEQIDATTLSLLIDGKSFVIRMPSENSIAVGERIYDVSVDDPRSWRGKKRSGEAGEGPQKLVASMPGKIVRVLAAEGDAISAGQGIAVIEAMKMQNEIKSAKAGVLKKLLVQPGLNVNAGEVLAIVE
jgi:biotin carboxyl carrier protein